METALVKRVAFIYQSAEDHIQALSKKQRTLIKDALARQEMGALARLRKKLGL